MLPYIISTAKVCRFLAHARFILYFHYTKDHSDVVSMYKTNLEVLMERIKQITKQHLETK
jgi:hypothetical protein